MASTLGRAVSALRTPTDPPGPTSLTPLDGQATPADRIASLLYAAADHWATRAKDTVHTSDANTCAALAAHCVEMAQTCTRAPRHHASATHPLRVLFADPIDALKDAVPRLVADYGWTPESAQALLDELSAGQRGGGHSQSPQDENRA